MSSSRKRAIIDAIVSDIEATQRALTDRGVSLRDFADESDHEALDIIRRIERKLKGKAHAQTSQASKASAGKDAPQEQGQVQRPPSS